MPAKEDDLRKAVGVLLDIPDIEVTFLEVDDGYGPFGAKTAGESGIILAPAAVANAIANAASLLKFGRAPSSIHC